MVTPPRARVAATDRPHTRARANAMVKQLASAEEFAAIKAAGKPVRERGDRMRRRGPRPEGHGDGVDARLDRRRID
jgi:hypothetical protein